MLLERLGTETRRDALAIGRKAPHDTVRDLIEQICRPEAWSAQHLAAVLGRSYEYLQQSHIKPMVLQGRLVRTQPNPTASNQTYRAADADD